MEHTSYRPASTTANSALVDPPSTLPAVASLGAVFSSPPPPPSPPHQSHQTDSTSQTTPSSHNHPMRSTSSRPDLTCPTAQKTPPRTPISPLLVSAQSSSPSPTPWSPPRASRNRQSSLPRVSGWATRPRSLPSCAKMPPPPPRRLDYAGDLRRSALRLHHALAWAWAKALRTPVDSRTCSTGAASSCPSSSYCRSQTPCLHAAEASATGQSSALPIAVALIGLA